MLYVPLLQMAADVAVSRAPAVNEACTPATPALSEAVIEMSSISPGEFAELTLCARRTSPLLYMTLLDAACLSHTHSVSNPAKICWARNK